jgi:hypothetical protein
MKGKFSAENQVGKKERHKEELSPIFNKLSQTEGREELFAYLTGNSNLPGQRANLELAGAFADLVEEHATEDSGKIWGLLNNMMSFLPEEAPVNDPKEFLPFCGVRGMAALSSACPQLLNATLEKLKALAEDKRWRIREAVAQSIQKLLTGFAHETLKALQSWIGTDNWLIMRAVAAGVAEPTLLKKPQIAKASYVLHQKILSAILAQEESSTDDFKVLRKTLGYSLSVIVESDPVKGFSCMHELVKSGDSDLHWIVNENLKKNRLIKNFPEEVSILKDTME